MKRKKRIYEPCFEVKGHIYMTPEGIIIPSVTEIIKAELNLYNFSSQAAAKRGEYVHQACQWHDEGRLKVESLDPVLIPFYNQYILFLKENPSVKILQNETMRYSPKYLYAGRADKLALVNGVSALIDLKTCNILKQEVWHKWQTAAYEYLFRHECGEQERYILYLTPDEYLFVKHEGKRDFYEFLTLLASHTIKINNGYRKQKEEWSEIE